MSNERIFLSPPHLGSEELKHVTHAFDINFIAPVGPHLAQFEKDFCAYTGIEHAVALSSGTAAMHLALIETGIKPGDEIIASTLTFIGSVSPATFVGAKPTFIDCDRSSWNMDLNLLDQAIKERASRNALPAAVIPTDLYGQCVDLDTIQSICAPYEIPVIVDAAEAMGARYKDRHAGKGAHAAIYSFNGNKIITTGGGGMLASDNEALVEHARFLSTQAKEPFPWYEHKEIGFNYRLSNVASAIGIGQLGVLDDRVHRKLEIFERYQARLGSIPGISFMPQAEYGRCNRWLTVMLIDDARTGITPEALRLILEEHNIESRPVWKPMHLQPVFKDARYEGGEVSECLFKQGLCLPSGTALTNIQIDEIADLLASHIA